MVITLCLYVIALWARVLEVQTCTVSILVSVLILATFRALFHHLTPTGRVTVSGRVVEVTPNVTGQSSRSR